MSKYQKIKEKAEEWRKKHPWQSNYVIFLRFDDDSNLIVCGVSIKKKALAIGGHVGDFAVYPEGWIFEMLAADEESIAPYWDHVLHAIKDKA